jgi:hypothetical protein
VARGFGYEIAGKDGDLNRVAVFSKRRIEAQETIFYRATLYQLDSPATEIIAPPALPESPYAKGNRPKVEEGEKEAPIYVAVDALIDEAREKSASDRTFVREIFKLASDAQDDRVQLLRDTVNVNMTTSDIAALLLEAKNVAVRTAHGLKLSADQRKAQFVKWQEVFIGGKWQAVDPESYGFGLKDKYAVWWYGDANLITMEGNANTDITISVRKNTNNALTRAIWKSGQFADILLKFSFYNLPIDTQIVFQVLLMIPVGGLVLAWGTCGRVCPVPTNSHAAKSPFVVPSPS